MLFVYLLMSMLMWVPMVDWSDVWQAGSKTEMVAIMFRDIVLTVFGEPGICNGKKPPDNRYRRDTFSKGKDTYWDYWDEPVFTITIIIMFSSIVYSCVASMYLVAKVTPRQDCQLESGGQEKDTADISVQTVVEDSRRTIPRKPRLDAERKKKKRKKKKRKKKGR